jgi:hypothetical protein
MNLATPLVVSAVWMLIFRKFPSWPWFHQMIERFPPRLKALWMGWTDCAYCGAFWIAMPIRYVTGLRFIEFRTPLVPGLDWPLDAVTTGLAVLFVIRVLDALRTVGEKH